MKPYQTNIQTFAAMFEGYAHAVGRFHEAAKTRDPTAAFIPLFEALNWAVSLTNAQRSTGLRQGNLSAGRGATKCATPRLCEAFASCGTACITTGRTLSNWMMSTGARSR
jgi:hypothetical protein